MELKMLEHLVLLKLKEDSTDEHYNNIVNSLKELPSKISAIRRLKVGKNFSDRNQGYNIGLSVTVNNKEDLDIYRFHPDHVFVLEKIIKPHLENVIAVDFIEDKLTNKEE
jgi:hypothetical protein